ncbi:CaiB/BaiF CoA transferase family protein [Leisingera daeponensis]|uniref:CaiB/BaiF CoA transferase family protein n=1 Tax=Leisingera daeponensis TaxID=405746 RepID=UPI001C94A4F7|nr:CaiB/BaiF CoA-transferase family protein [Leisingera daeponensis]MBY6059530.1 CoA transferase [Leisingera daeponensis]
MGPLDGLTVVTLEHAVAGPFATRQLADLGARVIKVERPGVGDFARNYDDRVDGLASYFVWANRSKESLSLNVKHSQADKILKRLVEDADILVQNLAPGAAERLGLTYDEFAATNPGLIVCNISGYGPDGPDRNRKAYDLLVQAEAGFLSVTGTEADSCKSGISIADIAAGMYAYSNILSALIQRSRTGKGCTINISMLEAMAEWMNYPLYYAYQGAPQPVRTGAMHATIFPYGPFKVGDGSRVMMGLQNEREWKVFCEQVLCHPGLVTDNRFDSNAKRTGNRVALTDLIHETFAELTEVEVLARLNAAGIANARMNDMAGLWNHPQLKARGRWSEVDSPVGPLPALLPPGGFEGYTPRMDPVPELGAHTAEILEQLGYSTADIASLRAENVL